MPEIALEFLILIPFLSNDAKHMHAGATDE